MIVLSPHYPRQFLPAHAPRIAMIDDRNRRGWRLLCQLVTEAGGELVIIPRTVSDRYLGTLGLGKERIKTLRTCADASLTEHECTLLETARTTHLEQVRKIFATVQAVILPGNEYDVPPPAYAEFTLHPKTLLPPRLDFRFDTECCMAKQALDAGIPVLGICGGMQLLVVLTGGRLLQHLPDVMKCSTAHEGHIEKIAQELLQWMECSYVEFLDDPRKVCPAEASHPVSITDDTSRLACLARKQFGALTVCENASLGVLSIHHQGALAEHINTQTLRITAQAPDGVVEAVEHVSHPFCIATQFHPEFDTQGLALPIMKALLAQCKGSR